MGEDRRDHRSWVVLELTRAGEMKSEEGTISSLLRDALRVPADHPVFVPCATYVTGGHTVTVHLMEGYAFVASGLAEPTYYNLEQGPYVRRVLTTRAPNGMRALKVLPDSEIQNLKRKLAEQVSSDIIEGMQVLVTEGTYGRLRGEVLDVDDEDASVRFTLRSIDLIARIPRVFLTPDAEES